MGDNHIHCYAFWINRIGGFGGGGGGGGGGGKMGGWTCGRGLATAGSGVFGWAWVRVNGHVWMGMRRPSCLKRPASSTAPPPPKPTKIAKTPAQALPAPPVAVSSHDIQAWTMVQTSGRTTMGTKERGGITRTGAWGGREGVQTVCVCGGWR